MGSVIPIKKSANSAYLDLKNILGNRLVKVENLIELKLESKIDLIKKMSDHHLKSGGKSKPKSIGKALRGGGKVIR